MVSTDVTAYFDFVKHEILIPELQQLGVEKGLIPPLRRMLKEWTSTPNTGIPQGPDASRVLGNFYMVAVDQVMDDFPGVKYFRYMDDMRIVGPSRSGVIDALQVLDQECRRRGLALSAQKTELLVGKRAVAAMSDSQLDAVHYAFQHATEDGSELRKRLVSIFKKALKRDGTVNTRWARFSLWRLYQLRADSVLSRVLGSLERLAPLGLLVVQYLHPWLRRPVVQRKITKYLNDAERNTSPYLNCWLMAAMLDIPDAIPPEWITYARSVALDRAAPTYHRTIALNVLALGQQARDLTSLREVARREYDPEVVRARPRSPKTGRRSNQRNRSSGRTNTRPRTNRCLPTRAERSPVPRVQSPIPPQPTQGNPTLMPWVTETTPRQTATDVTARTAGAALCWSKQQSSAKVDT